MQNNIVDGLNFVTCEQTFRRVPYITPVITNFHSLYNNVIQTIVLSFYGDFNYNVICPRRK